jgi:hypothetical protein
MVIHVDHVCVLSHELDWLFFFKWKQKPMAWLCKTWKKTVRCKIANTGQWNLEYFDNL